MPGRRGVLAMAAALVVLLAAGVVAWQAGWPPGIFGRRVSVSSGPVAVIQFTSDQGVILTGPGDRYRLAAEIMAADGHRRISKVLQWRSSDPAVVGVSAAGMVTAHAGTGSAVITVSAAGAAPQAAQVLVAQPAPGTELVPTGAVLTAGPGQGQAAAYRADVGAEGRAGGWWRMPGRRGWRSACSGNP